MTALQLTSSQRLPALLMAVTALWALIFAVAGLSGLAGRYRLHPDDPGQVPTLPALDLSRAQSLLQPLENYTDIVERPLFNPDRRPVPVEDAEGAGEEDAPIGEVSPLDILLTSVIITSTVKLAIVTDNRSGESQSVQVGDALAGEQAGWKLESLEPRKAVFAGPGGSSSIDLRVFDGAGGQAPTAAPVAPVAQAEGAHAPAQEDAAPAAETAEDAAAGNDTVSAEERATMIRRRIEERRRQMRAEAERANRK